MRMEMYLYQQAGDLYEFYHDKLRNEIMYGGHIGMAEYLSML